MGTVTIEPDRAVRAGGRAVLGVSAAVAAAFGAGAAGTFAEACAAAVLTPDQHPDLGAPDDRVMACASLAALAGALAAPTPAACLVDRPPLEAYGRLVAVVGFALLAAAGTALSPVPGASAAWHVAGMAAAGAAGAALLTPCPR